MDENFNIPLMGEKRNALVIRDNDTSRLRDALRIFQGNSFILNDSEIAVRYTLDNMHVLRNMGYKPSDTPSPILAKYDWPGMYKPMRHQKVMAEFLTMHKRCYNFSDMGVGKTAGSIWASHFLILNKKISRVLIICPLSVMKDAWLNDISRLLMGVHVEAAIGSRAKKVEAIQSKAQYLIINYDSVVGLKKELQQGGFDLIICDEATYLKNESAFRTKAVRSLVQPSTWVWMITGTPIAQSPMDAYGMAKICRPETVPKSMTQFKTEVMDKVTSFKWVPKPEAVTLVHNILQPAIRYKKEDCLDLPDKTYTFMEVEMTKEQNHYYEKMRKEQYLNLAAGEVTAVNAGVLLSKLLQISSGSVYDINGEYIEFDAKSRLDVMMEVIHNSSHKTLVFASFKHSVPVITKRLEQEGITYKTIGGATTGNKRAEIIHEFQNTPNPQVLVIQPRAASHGITLHAANTVIWYSPCLSAETYLQANDRVHRKGQKNPCTIVHIIGSSAERKVYRTLQNNVSTQTNLLDLYKEVIEND